MKTKQLSLSFTLMVVVSAGGESSSDSDYFNIISASGNYIQEKYGA